MSIRSLTDLAVERDATPHRAPVPAAAGRRRSRTGGAAATETTGDALLSAIPTEIIGAYTAASGLLHSLVKDHPRSYIPLRWWVFGVGAVMTIVSIVVVYRRKAAAEARKRRGFPGAELASATIAYTAWALVMPASALSAVLPDQLVSLVSGLITIGALMLLGLVTGRPMTYGSKTAE